MGELASLVIYLSIFCLSAALYGYGHHRKNKVMIWGSLLPPLGLASLRYMVGTDYGTYVSLFRQFTDISLGEYLQASTSAEPGFYLLIQISNLLTGDSALMFAIAAALTLGFFYLGLRRYNLKHPALVYLLFLLILFPMTLNVMRQGIAVAIVFYAFSFILDRNFKKYLFWMVIAGLFHVSAFILLPVYLLRHLIKPKRQNAYPMFLLKLAVVAGIVLAAIPLFSFLIMQIPAFSKYDMYTVNAGEGANYTLLLQAAVVLLGIVLARRAMKSKNAMLYMLILLFATLEVVFGTIGYSSTFIKRIGLYFSIFGFMLLAESTDVFCNRAGKVITSALVVMYGVIYFVIAYYLLGQSDVIPYRILGGV